MIRIINYTSANVLRLLASIIFKLNPNFKVKLKMITFKIVEANKTNIKMPNNLIHSLIIIEDKRYFYHFGIDTYSMFRAFIKNATTKKLEGASTIVQQLIRNLTNDRKIKFSRKINEVLLAAIISNKFSKDELLCAYLNTYKFNNCVGVASLCLNENYNLARLSNNEAAQIAARFKYPSITKSNHIKYLKRVRTIEKKQHLTTHLPHEIKT